MMKHVAASPSAPSHYHGISESCRWAWQCQTQYGCEPYWQYIRDGKDITDQMYAELDATEKRYWEGPDEPSEVWTREDRFYGTQNTFAIGYSEWERVS